jgi:DNA gyrase subunit A
MAQKKTKASDIPPIDPKAFLKGAATVIDTPLNMELSKSFMTYSKSVVYSRALVDARDGLKPVQRRILFTMLKEGFLPSKNYVKSARTTGTCMAIYHPHGDSSIYDAMAKMAQWWYLNIPFVDGFGNWGSSGGNGPAAPRYTEARLSPEAMLLLDEISQDTVDMRLNYDGEEEEPVVLPAQFPVLLINGAFGIAVGFSAQLAPHNPTEVLDATRYLLTHPNATLEKLMEYIPGPDFPTGGQILGMDQVKEAYATGQGKIRLRATAHIESLGRGRSQIVFTQMPYQLKTIDLLDKIKALKAEGKLQGLADAQNLTDRRNGIRFVVSTKTGINPEVLLNDLYNLTPLQVTFAINNVALVKGEPKTLGLKEMIEIFIEHRIGIIRRRSQNRRERHAREVHRIEGLLKALADIDEVIKIVRGSNDADVARDKLIKRFKVDDIQADYILGLELRRLTRFDQIKLQDDKKAHEEAIAELDRILSDDAVVKSVIGKELDGVRKLLDRERRTELIGGDLAAHLSAAKEVAASASVTVEDGPAHAVVYADGSVRRIDGATTVKAIKVGAKVVPAVDAIATTVHGKAVFISNKGRGYRIEMLQVSDKPQKPATLFDTMAKDEQIIAVAPADADKLGYGIFFGTKNGTVKIANPDYPVRQDDFDLIGLEKDDAIVGARWIEKIEESDIFFVSSDASLLRLDATKIRPQGRTGGGMAGLKLAAGQRVLAAQFVPADERTTTKVLTYSGVRVKTTSSDLYPAKGRGTGGVRAQAFLKGEDHLEVAYIGVNPVAVATDGKQVGLPPIVEKRDASGTPLIEKIATVGF